MICPEPKPRIKGMQPIWGLKQQVNDFSDIRNWRYRQFYILRKGQSMALAYMSEKDRGNIVLVSKTKTKELSPDSVQVLPDIDIKPLDFTEAQKTSGSIVMYKIAFIQRVGELLPAGTAEKLMTTCLCPFLVTWGPADKCTKQLKLATTTFFWLRAQRTEQITRS